MKTRLLLLFITLLLGCTKKQPTRNPLSAPAYTKQHRAGALTATYSLSQTNITTAQTITLLLDIQLPANKAYNPEIESPLPIGSLQIVADTQEPAVKLENGKQRLRRRWILAPTEPGEITLSPLHITVPPHELKTDAIILTITSLLPPDLGELTIRDITPAIEQPDEQTKQRTRTHAISAALVIALLLAAIIKQKHRRPNPPKQSPQQQAQEALRNLPADDQEKLTALTQILLTYLTETTALPIAGKTTAELQPLWAQHPQLAQSQTEIHTLLQRSEQARFSHIHTKQLSRELETFLIKLIEHPSEEA